eukprot:TRINITY_DN1585_c0_g1_i1.p1 TRINITY_DN1585_c0_g1~~TRINITY_DN1585_c0_g1_i1.p1  ORF type:complete len:785 (+),score=194.92 TRINITY_DN1585_c0_g1_i1:276-2630(+)
MAAAEVWPVSPSSGCGDPMLQPEEHGESPWLVPCYRRPAAGAGALRSSAASDEERGRGGSRPRKRRRRRKVVINTTFCRYDVVRRIAAEMSWVEDRDEDGEKGEFDVFWTDTSVMTDRVMKLQNYQRINHFPGMHLISRKIQLSLTLGKMRKLFPEQFSFAPRTWSLKSERNQFRKHLVSLGCKKTFIIKPSAGCQGKGIVLTQDPFELEEELEEMSVIQEYISRPLLIEGKKFDLRVYALVTSVRHPSVFIFNDGLVRLCTVDYTKPGEDNLDNVMMHLTNYAINKTSDNFVNADQGSGSTGHKRDFNFLNRWLRQEGHDVEKVWTRIDQVVVKTFLAALPQIVHVYNSCLPHNNDGYSCFEILGFDLLLDQNLKPWLLEVNHSPSFHTDTPLDDRIKSGVISEVLRLLNIQTEARARERERERDDFRRRINTQARRSQAKKAGEDGEEERRQLERERRELDEQERRRVELMVQQKRTEEDSLLENFRRVYPSPDPDFQELCEQVVEAAREANVPQTTQATVQRELERRKERQRMAERLAEEAALRRGLPRTGAPQVQRERPPRTGSAGHVRSGSPRQAVWYNGAAEREREREVYMQVVRARLRAQGAQRSDRLAEQMERHRRRISLGPRLSVFQLRDLGDSEPDVVCDLSDTTEPWPIAPPPWAGEVVQHSPISTPPTLPTKPPAAATQPYAQFQTSGALLRALAARISGAALPAGAPRWPPQKWIKQQCGQRNPVPIAYVAAPSAVGPVTREADGATIHRRLPASMSARVLVSTQYQRRKR